MAEYDIFIDVGLKSEQRYSAMTPGMEGRQLSTVTLEALERKIKQETEVELRDPTTSENFRARVIFSSNPEDLPGADKLWLVGIHGKVRNEPWAVRILERIDEEEGEVQLLARRRPSLTERRGKILEDLLKEREKKRMDHVDEK